MFCALDKSIANSSGL